MKTTVAKPNIQNLVRVAGCLYRSDTSHIYYGILKRKGRQVKKSLRTKDRALANRRLDALRKGVERLNTDRDAARLPFAVFDQSGALVGGIAQRWFKRVELTVKPTTQRGYLNSIKQLDRHFRGLTLRSLNLLTIERWATSRQNGRKTGQTGDRAFNMDLEVLRRILDYAVEHGLILENPARRLQHRRLERKPVIIPTKKQMRALLDTMRRRGAYRSADLVELLSYSGCRLTEIVGDPGTGKPAMNWGCVDFERENFRITKSKNREPRVVPLFPSLRAFLLRIKKAQGPIATCQSPLISIRSAMTALKAACKELGFPDFTHHSLRHFFCSNAIEAGVDFKTIAGWLGHKDGGMLVARTYGHLRDEHSAQMAKRMTYDASESMQRSDNSP